MSNDYFDKNGLLEVVYHNKTFHIPAPILAKHVSMKHVLNRCLNVGWRSEEQFTCKVCGHKSYTANECGCRKKTEEKLQKLRTDKNSMNEIKPKERKIVERKIKHREVKNNVKDFIIGMVEDCSELPMKYGRTELTYNYLFGHKRDYDAYMNQTDNAYHKYYNKLKEM